MNDTTTTTTTTTTKTTTNRLYYYESIKVVMTTSSSTHEQPQEIIEEDWSSYFHSIDNSNGMNNNSLLTGFSQHHEVTIQMSFPYSSPTTILLKLQCVESLTPIDMMNLSNGDNDSTGHRIWMGALFFIECFSCPLPPIPTSSILLKQQQQRQQEEDNDDDDDDDDDDDGCINNKESKKHQMIHLLQTWRKELFHQKHVLELGAGTGASGISLMVSSKYYHYHSTTTTTPLHQYHDERNCTCMNTEISPTSITFTDVDRTVLDLCQRNIENNYSQKISNDDEVNHKNRITHYVTNLEWGSSVQNNKDILCRQSYDTIIATDVIYDLGAIKPLFETASAYIRKDDGCEEGGRGYFVLSHIPRASIDCKSGKSIKDEIELLIVKEALHYGFEQVDFLGFSEEEEVEEDIVVSACCHDEVDDILGKDYCIRPRHLMELQREIITSNEVDFHDMESIGAGILIFKTKKVS